MRNVRRAKIFGAFAISCVAGLITSAAEATATLYHGAYVFTLAADTPTPTAAGYLLVSKNGFVLAAGEGAEPPAGTAGLEGAARVDVTGKIILPGFVSGHSHLWQSAFRGIAADGTLWPWIRALHRAYGQHVADGDMGAFTRHGAWDQLVHGVTTTHNHSHFLSANFSHYVEQAEVASATPQRVVFGWVNDGKVDDATWDARIAPYVARVKPTPDQPWLGLALNPTGVYRGAEMMRREREFAERHGLRVQMHYLEPAAEAEKDRANWPKLREGGMVNERTSFAHFIHPDEIILREAAEAGAAMIWNPLSNGRLGSGLPDIEAYLAAGLKVGMGEDGQASADISDPFENMRLGLYALRMRRQDAGGLQPLDILRMHTLDTATVLGVEKWVGSLEPGKFADFLVVDPGSPGTGPVWDPAAHVLFAISARNLRQVFVGGREVVRDGAVPGVDLAALEAGVAERIAALRARAGE